MKPFIILRIFKDNKLVEVKQFDQEQVVIGNKAEVTLDLDDDAISTVHCAIEHRDKGYYICDLGSQTGTFKNGQAVLDEPLNSGDDIQLGSYKIVFYPGVPKPASAPAAIKEAIPVSSIDKNTAVVKNEIPKTTVARAESPKIPAVETAQPLKSDLAKVDKSHLRPEIKKSSISSAGHKSKKTFAPASEVTSLKNYLRPGKGATAEVLVAWQERVLQTHHYNHKGLVRVGPDENQVSLPAGLLPKNWKLIELGAQVRLFLNAEAVVEVVGAEGSLENSELLKSGKLQQSASKQTLRLDQNEVVFVRWQQSPLQVIFRYTSSSPTVPLLPPWLLSGAELAGVIASIVMVAFLALYMSSITPEEPKEEEALRVAQVIFDKPPVPVTPPKPEPIVEKQPPKPTKPLPPPPPKKATVKEEKEVAQKKGKPTESPQSQKAQLAQKAAEVAPKPLNQNQPKKFTSTKQGAAIKTGDTAGANAQSANKDLSKVGLFSAFGGGGARSKIDQAYSGSGEVLGMAGKATGTSGFNENRAGDDLGSKFKDTGAGGKGTATQGISGVGTKGRSNGQSAYGASEGFGNKTTTNIEAGGAEESFDPSIDREAVRRVIRANIREIQSCYERELNKLSKGQILEGRVLISWTIVAKGAASNVKVANSSIGNKNIENCVRDRLASWNFPSPPDGYSADVSYPFFFKAQNQ
ncbi:MAG: AgmX/PglI C-terminal domain-containing protein [Pseudobdellovibrionaceae bacterium]